MSNLIGQPDANATEASSPEPTFRPALHGFAIVLMIATFVLLLIGGNVTSKDAGLAVPDWPTTFGHNMFFAPPHLWTGPGNEPQFWEHAHRLMGSLVGGLMILMVLWLMLSQQRRPWLIWYGLAMLLAVIVQGIMGGLRVTEISLGWAYLHGVLGQLFLCMTVILTAATGRFWIHRKSNRHECIQPAPTYARLGSWALLTVLLIQLLLGAAVRHTKAGLAIPDFPLSYGQLIPPLAQDQLDAIWAKASETGATLPYRVNQVAAAFAHRTWSVVVVAVTLFVALTLRRLRHTARPSVSLLLLLTLQMLLGALIIWTSRRTDIATAHQAIGAAVLGVATLLAIRVHLGGSARSSMVDKTKQATTGIHPSQGKPA